MNSRIRAKAKKRMTAEQLLEWYYINERDTRPEDMHYIKEQSASWPNELKELKEIMESPNATDEIEIKGGIKIPVNLHKQDVDVTWALRRYKSNSDYMNNLLRQDEDLYLEPSTIKDIENTSSALKKLKPYQGTVYRYDHRQELPKVGETITIPNFYSTAADKEDLEHVPYFSTRKTFYEIESKTGKLLPWNGEYGNEHEVLFDLGTKFEVVGAEKKGTKNYIKLREK